MEGKGGPILVGRERELERLAASIGSDSPVAVVGEAGIGKTSLVRAAASSSARRLVEGGGFATLSWMPYLALRRAVGRDLDGDPSHVAAIVERAVGPDILFVDDLQWVDRQSLAVVELLVGRVLLLVAIRGGEPETGGRLEIVGRLGFDIIRLEPLDPLAGRVILQRLRPDLRNTAVARLTALAAGNPLILEELAVRGVPSTRTTRTIEARLARLSPGARRLVELLAVADRPLPRSALDHIVSEPLEAGLLIEHDAAVEVRHALLAESIRERLDSAARSALHAQVADLVDEPAEAARHLAAAGLSKRAAAAALAALDLVQGPTGRAALLVIAAEASEADESFERRLEAARALDRLADWEGVIGILPDGDADESAHLQAERDALLAHAAYSLGRHADARARLELARTRPIDPGGPVAARVAWEVAALMVNVDGAIGPAIAYLEGQLPLQPDGSPGHWGLRVLRESIGLLAGQDIDINLLRAGLDGAFAMRSFATAADLAKVINIALLVGNGSEPALGFLHEQVARFDEAEASSVALEFLAEVVQVDVIAGRLDDAVSDADEVAERPAPRRARQAAAIFRGVALAALGRLDDADEALRTIEESVTGDWFGRGELLAAQAQVALWSGRAARAIELIDTAIAIPSPIVGGHILPQLTRAWASVEVGAPFETIDAPIRSLAGASPEFEGLRLLAVNQADAAAVRFAEAAALWDGFQALRMMTCRWAEGEALRQSGSPSAADRLTLALEAAEACRFESLAVRVRRSLRLAGIRVAAGDRRSYAVAPRLTGRERELVELVGHGLTNLEIARRMGLGRPTVSRILSNAMGKLGAESRAHAVALASELD